MIKRVMPNNRNKKTAAGRLYFPKKFIGKYVEIRVLSEKEKKECIKLIKKHEQEIKKREKQLKIHINKLKELRNNRNN